MLGWTLLSFFFQNPENTEKLDLAPFFHTIIEDMYIPENASKVNIPEGYEPYFAVTLGYPTTPEDCPCTKKEYRCC